jgi:hypothetical protein
VRCLESMEMLDIGAQHGGEDGEERAECSTRKGGSERRARARLLV